MVYNVASVHLAWRGAPLTYKEKQKS